MDFFKIKKMKVYELKKIASIMKREYNKRKHGNKWTKKTSEDRVKEIFKSNPNTSFSLHVNGRLVGVLAFQIYTWNSGKHARVLEFAIKEKEQGKGFGKQALKFLEDYAKKQRLESICLETQKNEKAIELYKKSGFEEDEYIFMSKEIKKR